MTAIVNAIRRGDVWLVELDPARGTEANKTRPAIVVSNNGVNNAARASSKGGVVTLVPLTSNTSRIHDFQALIHAGAATGLSVDSKAQCEQLRSVHVGRLVSRLGAISAEELAAVEDALVVQLNLEQAW
jgi:mRNA interferase MazF